MGSISRNVRIDVASTWERRSVVRAIGQRDAHLHRRLAQCTARDADRSGPVVLMLASGSNPAKSAMQPLKAYRHKESSKNNFLVWRRNVVRLQGAAKGA